MGSASGAVISSALLVLFAIPSQAQTPVTDLAALNLRVAEANVVPELPLSGSLSGPQFQVRPEKGMKLVAVTLNGELKAPGRYIVWPQLFAVLFEEDQAPLGRRVKVEALITLRPSLELEKSCAGRRATRPTQPDLAP